MRPSLKGKNILITGGGGFIGSHLIDYLIKIGANQVITIENFFVGNLTNLKEALNRGLILYTDDAEIEGSLQYIFENHNIDAVFNCATKALNYSFFNPANAYMTNVVVLKNLLELQRKQVFKTLCHFSSSEVYGSALYEPMDEEHPFLPTTTYAAGKASADILLQSYVKMFNIDAFIVRPFNNYGPRQNYKEPLAGVIPRTIQKILSGDSPEIHGSGQQKRDFIYVTDTIRAVTKVYEKLPAGESINISSNNQFSIEDVIKKICSHMNYKGEIIRKNERVSDVKIHLGCNEKLKKLAGGDLKMTDFETGLLETINWYRDVIESGEQKLIRLVKPYISYGEIEEDFKAVFSSGIFTKGEYVKKFQEEMKRYLGSKHCYFTTSATTALTMALKVVNVGIEDEVIISDFSFPATVNVVEDLGAVPVFADVDLDTFNMKPEELERKITDKTKAVIFVDAIGNPSGILKIKKICETYQIPLIQDSACSIGSSINGIKVGIIADITCFSFHPRKMVTTGEGGAIVTNNNFYAQYLDMKLNHGAIWDKGVLDFVTFGYNYRLPELQAVMGMVQLSKLDTIIKSRNEIKKAYESQLSHLGFKPQIIDKNVVHNIQSIVFTLPTSIDRDDLIRFLSKNNVESTIGTYCLSNTTYYKNKYKNIQKNAKYLEERTITLPCYEGVPVNMICNFIKNYCNNQINNE
jgi:dTDP-4-amino-4,6-dideoxygalactose transaminase/dTDP-D-glucose 4,6-dehydratase